MINYTMTPFVERIVQTFMVMLAVTILSFIITYTAAAFYVVYLFLELL